MTENELERESFHVDLEEFIERFDPRDGRSFALKMRCLLARAVAIDQKRAKDERRLKGVDFWEFNARAIAVIGLAFGALLFVMANIVMWEIMVGCPTQIQSSATMEELRRR